MNELLLDAIELLLERGWQEVVPMVILAAARCLGLTYGFTLFAWGMPAGRLARVALTITIGMPMVFGNLSEVHTLVAGTSMFGLGLMILTEIGIGFGMGFLLSLPFVALPAAGVYTDQFRGESDSGHASPTGGSISTYGMLYSIIAFLVFVTNNGLLYVVKLFYQSYEVWPLNYFDFSFNRGEVVIFMTFLGEATLITLSLCFPLLITLFAVEGTVVIAARIAKRFNFYNLDFLLKNFLTVLLLPLVALYVLRFSEGEIMVIYSQFDLLEFMK